MNSSRQGAGTVFQNRAGAIQNKFCSRHDGSNDRTGWFENCILIASAAADAAHTAALHFNDGDGGNGSNRWI
jgi:hypothetical protein